MRHSASVSHPSSNRHGAVDLPSPNNLYPNRQYRDTAPTNTPTPRETLSRRQITHRCALTTKVSYVPNRMPLPKQLRGQRCQMRVTDKETRQLGPHPPLWDSWRLLCDRCRCNVSITFRRFPLVDMVGRYVGAFTARFSHRQFLVFIHD